MLKKVIESLKLPEQTNSTFSVQINTEYDDLHISIKDYGELTFPISAKNAKALIKLATPVKFGWRDQTLEDPAVRSGWEISKKSIEIDQASWDETLIPVLQEVKKQLGIPKKSQLSAHLHDLLIYESGNFFAGHQDSEKENGMIGTLVVLLPSDFRGGSFVIDQHGDKRVSVRPPNITKSLTFIAFYADCHHEVKKITSGYRLALTYNLVLDNSTALPLATNDTLAKAVKEYFQAPEKKEPKFSRSEAPRWLVYLLDHEYSEKSLNWDQLKGVDRTRASQFKGVAKKLGLEIYLALLDVHETWDTEEDYDYYRRGRRSRYWDDEENDPEHVVTTELLVEEYELYHWINEKGEKSDFEGRRSIDEEMMCWSKSTEELSPFKTEYEGWMGNYGNTLDRWYHRAAIVLWPEQNNYASLFVLQPEKILSKVNTLLEKDLTQNKKILEQILPQWRKLYKKDPKKILQALNIAATVHDPKLANDLLEDLDLEALNKTTIPGLQKLFSTYGENWGLLQIQHWAKKDPSYRKTELQDFLALIQAFHQDYSQIVDWLFNYHLTVLIQKETKSEKEDSNLELAKESKTRLKEMKEFLVATREAKKPEFSQKAIHSLLALSHAYTPEMLSQLCQEVLFEGKDEPEDPWGLQKLLNEARERLQAKLVLAKREQGDFSILTRFPCVCRDCQELKLFLESKTQENYIWPLGQDRRSHLERMINNMNIPVKHETQRKGSPHKLVLKKNPNLFQLSETHCALIQKEIEALNAKFL